MLWGQGQNQAIASDSKSAITQLAHPMGIWLGDVERKLPSTAFQQHEVIA
jgi:hypothetical protein